MLDARVRVLLAMCGLLTGCNAVFGLDRTTAAQEFFDAAPDAPFSCPGVGDPPRFKRRLVQVTTQACSGYTVSQRAGTALAACREPAPGYYAGSLDGELVPAVGLAPASGEYLEDVRLAADGDLAVGRACDFEITRCRFATFARGADATWAPGPDLPIPMTFSTRLSPLSLGPARRAFVTDADNGRWEEWVEEAGGAWRPAGTYTPIDLGLDSIYDPALAPDGLRMIFYARPSTADYAMYYVDRPSLDARFGPARLLDVAAVPYAQLTEDCGRLYFGALGTTFYVERE